MHSIRKRVPQRSPTCQKCGSKITMPDGRITTKAAYRCRIDHGSMPQLMLWNGKQDYQSRQSDVVYKLCGECAYKLSEVISEWISQASS